MRKLGIVLVFVVVGGFVAMMAVPGILAPLGPLFCQSGEHFVTNQSVYHPSPGETDTANGYYCVNGDGQQRDISGQLMPPIIIGYIALLLISLWMANTPTQKPAKSKAKQAGSLASANGSHVIPWTADDEAEMQAEIDQMPKAQRDMVRFGGQEVPLSKLKSGAYQHVASADSKHTLTETLRDLSEAHTQGLISDDEYQQLRQEALDKLK